MRLRRRGKRFFLSHCNRRNDNGRRAVDRKTNREHWPRTFAKHPHDHARRTGARRVWTANSWTAVSHPSAEHGSRGARHADAYTTYLDGSAERRAGVSEYLFHVFHVHDGVFSDVRFSTSTVVGRPGIGASSDTDCVDRRVMSVVGGVGWARRRVKRRIENTTRKTVGEEETAS